MTPAPPNSACLHNIGFSSPSLLHSRALCCEQMEPLAPATRRSPGDGNSGPHTQEIDLVWRDILQAESVQRPERRCEMSLLMISVLGLALIVSGSVVRYEAAEKADWIQDQPED